jgi:hypothetical protein
LPAHAIREESTLRSTELERIAPPARGRRDLRARLQIAVTERMWLPLHTHDYRSVKTQLAPLDRSLYRRLLTAPLEMPKELSVLRPR